MPLASIIVFWFEFYENEIILFCHCVGHFKIVTVKIFLLGKLF